VCKPISAVPEGARRIRGILALIVDALLGGQPKRQSDVTTIGAPDECQNGARSWAGIPPNLVNVVAGRALEAFYVIGNRALLQKHGRFGVVSRRRGGRVEPTTRTSSPTRIVKRIVHAAKGRPAACLVVRGPDETSEDALRRVGLLGRVALRDCIFIVTG